MCDFDDDYDGGYDDGYDEGFEDGFRSGGGGGNSGGHSQGCYVATFVYGSYDCPEVWTLRRFRDHVLRKHAVGRAFIRAYYAISPTLVKWFGEFSWFRVPIRRVLDRIVGKLNRAGIRNTDYRDQD